MSIEVLNITKKYGAQEALKNVSFSIKKGEIVGFLGPNGAGKSTTMKIITNYLNPSNGCVEIYNKDIANNKISVDQFAAMARIPAQARFSSILGRF